jgi:hypothetical protein
MMLTADDFVKVTGGFENFSALAFLSIVAQFDFEY